MDLNIVKRLIELADQALKIGDSPVSAIIVKDDEIISQAYNTRNITNNTLDHAEIKAIASANEILKSWRLNNCSLYVTIKPCEMCESVIKEARIANVYYLIDRLEEKKQHNRTNITELSDDYIIYKESYNKKVSEFWKSIRKKD